MMRLKQILLILLLSELSKYNLVESQIEEYITPCHIGDPKLNQCIKNIFNNILKYIRQGLRELNLPPLDPLYVEEPISFETNGHRLKFYDTLVRGFSNWRFTEVKSNIEKFKVELRFKVPKIVINSKYEASGRLFGFPFTGAGTIVAQYDNVEGITRIYGRRVTRNNQDYLYIDRLKSNFIIQDKGYKIRDDINPALSEFYTEQANIKLPKSIQTNRVEIERNLSLVFKEILQSVFDTIPINSYLIE